MNRKFPALVETSDIFTTSPGLTRSSACPRSAGALIVEKLQARRKEACIAAAVSVSRVGVSTSIDRFATDGEVELEERSSQPHSSSTHKRRQ